MGDVGEQSLEGLVLLSREQSREHSPRSASLLLLSAGGCWRSPTSLLLEAPLCSLSSLSCLLPWPCLQLWPEESSVPRPEYSIVNSSWDVHGSPGSCHLPLTVLWTPDVPFDPTCPPRVPSLSHVSATMAAQCHLWNPHSFTCPTPTHPVRPSPGLPPPGSPPGWSKWSVCSQHRGSPPAWQDP